MNCFWKGLLCYDFNFFSFFQLFIFWLCFNLLPCFFFSVFVFFVFLLSGYAVVQAPFFWRRPRTVKTKRYKHLISGLVLHKAERGVFFFSISRTYPRFQHRTNVKSIFFTVGSSRSGSPLQYQPFTTAPIKKKKRQRDSQVPPFCPPRPPPTPLTTSCWTAPCLCSVVYFVLISMYG